MIRNRMIKLIVFFFIFPVLTQSSHLFSQERKGYSGMFEGAATLCKVHSGGFSSPGLAFRVRHMIKNSGVGFEASILACTSFLSLDAGFRLGASSNGKFSPFFAGGVGIGTCGEWFGLIIRGNFGIEAEIGPRSIFIATYQIGTHGGQAGPSFFSVGVGYRFGLRK